MFVKNLKYLINLLRKEKGLTKIHLINELKISRTTLYNWERGGNITKGHLQALIDYFNRYLIMNINQEMMLHQDIQALFESPNSVQDVKQQYLSNIEQELIRQFRQLKNDDKELILNIMRKITKN